MTNNEAVTMIKNDMRLHHNSLSGAYRQALNMAVEALKFRDAYKIVVEAANKAFENKQSVWMEWIPCSERLPEEKDAGILKKLGTNKRSDYVIATVEVKGERMTVTACTYDGVWNWDMKYAFPDFKVVAWMPLPKPYQEDNQ